MNCAKTDKIDAYGVILHRLKKEDIELVRTWRNDPKISRFMEYREYISTGDQKKWFSGLDSRSQFYFIIQKNNSKVGLVNIKNVDFEKKSGEGGLFIYDDIYRGSSLAGEVVFAMYDFGFEQLGLKQITAHILRENKRAIHFNKALGFKLSEKQETVDNQLYLLSKNDYYKKSDRIKKWLTK